VTLSSEEQHRFVNGEIRFVLDCRLFRVGAIQKTAYRLAGKCTAVLEGLEDQRLPVRLLFAPGTTEREAHEIARLFHQELVDQELREKIGEETQPVRALILAHAFSKTDLVRRQ